MADRNYFKLDVNAPIFEELAKEKPTWWKTVCADQELYINIRKDNRINVYYKGASVIDLSFKKGQFTAKISSEYLDTDWKSAEPYYQTEPAKIVSDLNRIKVNIDNHYKLRKRQPEGASEKEIQGKEYTQGEYIDSEYAFVYSQPSRLIIRIDLTTVRKDGMIEFVELKRISDNRLLHVEGSTEAPEILRQMHDYCRFITEYHSDIISYYKKVQAIMTKIGVRNPFLNCDIKGGCPYVRLLFAPYTDGKADHPKREKRIQRIADLLAQEGIISNINEI